MEFEFSKDKIKEWAGKYDDCYNPKEKSIEEQVKNNLRSQRYLTQPNLYDIMVWKAARIKNYAYKNAPSRIVEITRRSFKTNNKKEQIESLLGLRGVGYPVASVILHFAFPDKYPILDFRVIHSLKPKPFNLIRPSVYRFDFREKYCGIIR